MKGKNKLVASKSLMLEIIQDYLQRRIVSPVPLATNFYWNGSMFTIEMEPRK